MDFMGGVGLAMLAASKELRDKLIIMGIGMLLIGFLFGVLLSFIVITTPLTDAYNTQLMKFSQNGTLKCFDTVNMSTPVVVDFPNIQSYCTNLYVLNGLKNETDPRKINFPFMKQDELNLTR
jgi:uncharacterized membrane protein YeiB